MFVGVIYGAISGFLGGRVDDVMQRIIEILNGVPSGVVAILAMIMLSRLGIFRNCLILVRIKPQRRITPVRERTSYVASREQGRC